MHPDKAQCAAAHWNRARSGRCLPCRTASRSLARGCSTASPSTYSNTEQEHSTPSRDRGSLCCYAPTAVCVTFVATIPTPARAGVESAVDAVQVLRGQKLQCGVMTAQGRRALGTQDEPAGREVGPSQPLLHAETKKKWAHKSVEMRPSQSTCKGSDDCKDLMTAESKDEEDRRSYCLSGGAE
ncbi:hypothetical protein F444_19992 [Phytophthora nicotianae P1976]|uniref:Uncharacterized protein n=3 Tax=Phytophthora nicotianae TaxID=4792 RepID=A0A080Z5Y6_PHYNI|nr:hypothetical protein F444_19992 [Phytophthora nicotianae P1976]